MFCWWCANLSFWGAAGALGLLVAVDALLAARATRRTRAFPSGGRAGQAYG